jgi:hypothetical protein
LDIVEKLDLSGFATLTGDFPVRLCPQILEVAGMLFWTPLDIR